MFHGDYGATYLVTFGDANFSSGKVVGVIGEGYARDHVGLINDASDGLGYAVAMDADGNRVAIGVPNDGGSGNSTGMAGAVYLLSFSDTSFGGILEAIIGKGYSGGKHVNVSALAASDQFGYGVSLDADSNRLAVGAPGDDGSSDSVDGSGAVYLFSFIDTSFSGGSLTATIGDGYTGGDNYNVSALDTSDGFGRSVSLAADSSGYHRLAVGAYGDDGSGDSTFDAGAVYLLTFTDADFSGAALAATIGSGYSGGRNISNTNLAMSDNFGQSVALDSDANRLAVGASGDDGSSNSTFEAGAVYLYSFGDSAFGSGSLAATIGSGYSGGNNVSHTALDDSDQFGYAVALNDDGDRLAVGAIGDDGSGFGLDDYGAVYLYTFTNTSFSGGSLASTMGRDYGSSDADDIHIPLDSYDGFGSSVALDSDGDRLLVGSHGDGGFGNSFSYSSSGVVYAFTFADTSFSQGVLSSNQGRYHDNQHVGSVAMTDQFGYAVALDDDGNRLAVGVYGDDGSDNSTSSAGAVHLFSFTDSNFSGGSLDATLGKGYSGGKNVDVSALASMDYFGAAVALDADGNRLAVGAPGDDGSGNAVMVQALCIYLPFQIPRFQEAP